MKRRVGQKGRRALVIGGSMAGLLAARVLSDFYDNVILIERDTLATRPEQRRGVVQGRHAHGLLASGVAVLEDFFSGISDELIAKGALGADVLNDAVWFFEGGCLKRVPSGTRGLLASRPLLESLVRERTRKTCGIQILDNCAVDGLFSYGGSVKGVRIDGGILEADLVVDATGRGSRVPQWLESIGFAGPREDKIEMQLAYTTRLFKLRPGRTADFPVLVVPPTPEGKRGGVLLAQEDGAWIATLFGHFGQKAPGDLEGFVEYAKSLAAPNIYDFLQNAEPVGEAAFTRFPTSSRRRYENLKRFPDGLLVFGDAICSFNPAYGQGMSVAALQANALRDVLGRGGANLAGRFFRKAARVIDTPWNIAAGGDLRMPETVGPRTLSMRLINWYISKLRKAAHQDAELSVAFIRVAQLLARPDSLLRPALLLRVLLSLFGRRPENTPAMTAREITAS
ncbi:MAG: FAD-dependent oxidoreductase [Blastocatellia bacterium]